MVIDTDVFAVAAGSHHSLYLSSAPFDPLIRGTPVEGLEDWFLSDWFGYYCTAFAPWLFHFEHGFIYRHEESTDLSTYFYDAAIGAWWWTSQDRYPELYIFDPPADLQGTDIGSEWLFYQLGSVDPREFVDGRPPVDVGPLYFGP